MMTVVDAKSGNPFCSVLGAQLPKSAMIQTGPRAEDLTSKLGVRPITSGRDTPDLERHEIFKVLLRWTLSRQLPPNP